jgi:hypothetical protein
MATWLTRDSGLAIVFVWMILCAQTVVSWVQPRFRSVACNGRWAVERQGQKKGFGKQPDKKHDSKLPKADSKRTPSVAVAEDGGDELDGPRDKKALYPSPLTSGGRGEL